jgi:hypothetical protein
VNIHKPETIERIWRIRRYYGRKGGANYYHHSDVIAPTWQLAIKAAKDKRMQNWRCVDKFDISEHDYCTYEYLYEVTDNPKKPAKPI